MSDVSDVPVFNFDMSRCGIQGAIVNETIDDLVIFAIVTQIDGVGRVLASAGPCILRTQSRFPVIGVMRFDVDDIQSLSSNGRLASVVLHEMLHVIGIGTLWRARDMLIGSGSSDPRFIGNLAGNQCIVAGGFASCGDGRVPVENSGGSGTVEVHWRESVFDAEVMTGFVESNADDAAVDDLLRVAAGPRLRRQPVVRRSVPGADAGLRVTAPLAATDRPVGNDHAAALRHNERRLDSPNNDSLSSEKHFNTESTKDPLSSRRTLKVEPH